MPSPIQHVLPTLQIVTLEEVRECLDLAVQNVGSRRLPGVIGGWRRRVRRRVILDFLTSETWPDRSMWALNHLARELFGRGIDTAERRVWATPGRKADHRVDMKGLLHSVSDTMRSAAAQCMQDLEADFSRISAAIRTERSRAALLQEIKPNRLR